jgi:hypothetical protein
VPVGEEVGLPVVEVPVPDAVHVAADREEVERAQRDAGRRDRDEPDREAARRHRRRDTMRRP